MGIYFNQNAKGTPFDNTGTTFTKTNVQEAIEEAKITALKRNFNVPLHFVSGTGLNTSMSNGAFFRVYPGTFASGSYSGYPSSFPTQMPYNSKINSMSLTFRVAAFDFNTTAGTIKFDIEFRLHQYNGSTVYSIATCSFGSFSGNSTGAATHVFELLPTTNFVFQSGYPETFSFADMIGYRFVKTASVDRAINSFTDVRLTLNMENVL